jgi:hypothetical protein
MYRCIVKALDGVLSSKHDLPLSRYNRFLDDVFLRLFIFAFIPTWLIDDFDVAEDNILPWLAPMTTPTSLSRRPSQVSLKLHSSHLLVTHDVVIRNERRDAAYFDGIALRLECNFRHLFGVF